MREVRPTQKPVPSSDIKDLFFNSGLLDIWATSLERKYIDRFGNCHLTAAGMEWLFKELVEKFKVDMNTAIVAAGYITIDSFQQGADLPNNELTQRNHILRDETTGEYYRWDGDLPKQVPAGSMPQSTGGIGKGAWVSVGDASLRSDLTIGSGILLIKNATLECNSVSDAVQVAGIDEGRKVRTYKYNVDVITDWVYTKTKPTGSQFYIDAIDGYLVLLTPNFASAGIIEGAYDPQSAANNRNVIQRLVRDERFDNFSFGCVGLFYVLGSIHPLRDNIKINHENGVTLLGRYNDPSISPNVMGLNAGHMWGFAHYRDPDSPIYDENNYVITNVTENTKYILDGEIGTEYNEIHTAKHNNNPIGWAKSYNCHVTGRGGVICSDHKGITFDADADMCSIDIEYVRKTSNAPVQMKCIDGGYGSIKVNSVSDILFDGGITKSVAWCQGGSHDVTVNKFEWDGVVKPILVYANGCDEVNINAGVINGVSQICRQLNTSVVRIHSTTPKNTDSILNKAENAAGLVKSSEIRGVRALDNVLTSIFYDETKLASQQDQVVIVDNDFRKGSPSLLYFNGKETQNIPRLWDVRNNVDPDGLINFTDWNLLVGQSKTQTVAASSFTITVNRRFENISVNLSESSTARFLNINLKAHLLTTVTVSYPIGNTSLVVSRNGDNLTFSLNAGTINFYMLN
ncbi:phage tail protein [Providencia rettgeri]|uniref:tail fiber/spike domain-containing protein n=1 Tax=Providencia rettgeri TaxID=587 RepID=UPI00221E4E72|nr:phage tail protein [Providencia rettgeri]ELR5279989.1 phage tail protein [Providencia rettgeri]UYV40380.1 phage tail protein [Providencia rettgeri]